MRGLLSYLELCELVEQGVITADPANINAASIDITLHDVLMLEDEPKFNKVVNLARKENIEMRQYAMSSEHGYRINPGEFVLASSVELFNLPNDISAIYVLKSSMARNGLNHLNAGFCDAGWNNSRLTLEFHNVGSKHVLKIEPGMKCGQLLFFRHLEVPDHASYATKGQYNNQAAVTVSKGVR